MLEESQAGCGKAASRDFPLGSPSCPDATTAPTTSAACARGQMSKQTAACRDLVRPPIVFGNARSSSLWSLGQCGYP
jgi:hypothetical protein